MSEQTQTPGERIAERYGSGSPERRATLAEEIDAAVNAARGPRYLYEMTCDHQSVRLGAPTLGELARLVFAAGGNLDADAVADEPTLITPPTR